MTCLKESRLLLVVFVLLLSSCKVIKPKLITEQTPFDTDDPAIWVNRENPSESIVFGTDKDEENGGVYAFDLDGKIKKEMSITGLSYPNNVDVAYDFKLNDSIQMDIIGFTEREKNQIRLFSIPQIKSLDNGGFSVFEDEKNAAFRRPMGIAFYQNKETGSTYIIVSRKEGPLKGYLYQYQLITDNIGLKIRLVRKFGDFSGKKEIEAIGIDNELGFIYYSDENHCIRKYYADPDKGNQELACFGREYFKRDIEGIAIVKYPNDSGYLIVSNQQAHRFSVFDRITNEFIKEINLGTSNTDGCEVVNVPLGDKYPNGLFVSMTDSKTFYFHDLGSLNLSLD